MKRLFAFFAVLVLPLMLLAAQGSSRELFDWDIDSLFDEPLSETHDEGYDNDTSSALDEIKKRGLIVDISFEFQGGIAPGWDLSPWYFDGEEVFTWGIGVRLNSHVNLDARISDAFRVKTVFNINIPGPVWFSLGDFFFDYDFGVVFLRGGKYEHSWGISPNFGFTNLLSRIPDNNAGGESYVLKVDVPIGIGGIQALALTRVNLTGDAIPGRGNIGFGGKYNLAFRWADFDIGAFYQDKMALRSFLSIKTTVFNTELYNEWLVAVNTHLDNETTFACNFGFARDFFGEKISINGEIFYNGEESSYFYRPETTLRDAETVPFIEDISMAINFLYRFNGKAEPRFFVQMYYAPAQSSAQLIPGFKLTPSTNVEVYLAVPMALGNINGYYYQNTADPALKNRPFCISLLVTFTGNVQADYRS